MKTNFTSDGRPLLDAVLENLFFLTLLVLAVVFYKERVAMLDSGDYLFKMLIDSDFHIVHGRYGAFFSQILPFIGLKMGAPLKWIMIAYSVNFILLYYACYQFALKICGNQPVARAIILFSVLSVISTFYWPVSEIFQGLIYVLVTYAWLSSPKKRNAIFHTIILILLVTLSLYTHPLVVVPTGFVLIFYGIDKEVWRNRRRLLVFLIPLVCLVFIYLSKGLTGYDKTHADKMFNFQNGISGYFGLPSVKAFWNCIWHEYKILLFGTSAITLVYLALLKWLKALAIVVFMLSYFALITTSYPSGGSGLIIENLLLPMGAVLSLLLCIDGFTKIGKVPWQRMAFWALVIFSLVKLINGHQPFSKRVAWYNSLIENVEPFDERKFLINHANHDESFVPISWAACTESLLISSVHSANSTIALRVGGSDEIDEMMARNRQNELVPYMPWWKFLKEKDLPVRWFNLSNSAFKNLNRTDSFTRRELLAAAENIVLFTQVLDRKYASGSRTIIQAQIESVGPGYLPSHSEVGGGTFLSYRFFRENQLVKKQYPETPLMMDVFGQVKQPLPVKMPRKAGDYELEFVLVIPDLDGVTISSAKMPFSIK